MSASKYDTLSVGQKVAAADEIAEHGSDAELYEAFRNKALDDSENGCYHAIGEPTSSIRCDECCGSIALGTECATLKCFARQEDTDEEDVDWEPQIICLKCADSACVDAEYKVGFVVRGVLERRRTRPGDPCSAPYVYYIAPDEESPSTDLVTNVEKRDGSCFDCW